MSRFHHLITKPENMVKYVIHNRMFAIIASSNLILQNTGVVYHALLDTATYKFAFFFLVSLIYPTNYFQIHIQKLSSDYITFHDQELSASPLQ